jgi:hypothetical protein
MPLLTIGIVSAPLAQSMTVPFDVCAQSTSWTRPTPGVQAKIWSDPRYRDVGPRADQWTHSFLFNEPDSASVTYENQILSGLWTDPRVSQCPRRDTERNVWTELWALNHRITVITLDGLVYTVDVTQGDRGYEIVQFRRPESLGQSKAMLRVVNDDGRTLGEWVEASPSAFVPVR